METISVKASSAILVAVVNILFLSVATNTSAYTYEDVQASFRRYTSAKEGLCFWSGCNTTAPGKDSEVEKYCKELRLNMTGRCCYQHKAANSENYIVGLDLSNCNIKNVTFLDSPPGGDPDLVKPKLAVLELEGNPLKTCDPEAFDNMNNLTYLSLPPSCSCPGGDAAWENVTSIGKQKTVCYVERDLCDEESVTCPSNSHCHMQAPGTQWCVCDNSYYGYKCLRQGIFPMGAFAGGLTGATVGVSALLWVVLRRKANKKV